MVHRDDVVIAISQSGETGEVLRLLETIRRLGARLIGVTGAPASTLAQAADLTLDCHVAEEACPLNLVPTASTTAALALGDALAMTLLIEKGFREEDFANLHPGGKLGKKLMRVEALMHGGDLAPMVDEGTSMRDVIYEMSRKGLGMACVMREGRLSGIITDGDLRRRMIDTPAVLALSAADVMTSGPVTIGRSILAAQALHIMEQRKITSLIVATADGLVEGVLHLHDLWRTELF
jgi:arabinose-5-phosphate isomerase